MRTIYDYPGESSKGIETYVFVNPFREFITASEIMVFFIMPIGGLTLMVQQTSMIISRAMMTVGYMPLGLMMLKTILDKST